MTAFFRQEHHDFLKDKDASAEQMDALHARMRTLHETLYPRMRANNLDLHLYPESAKGALHTQSVADVKTQQTVLLAYLRDPVHAVTVERLMGREEVASEKGIEIHRHPVIELRLTPEHFVVEFLISPDAWWDQQNLAGRLTVDRHRDELYQQLRQMPHVRLGFWQGVHLSDMHMDSTRFHRTALLTEWLSTFEPGKDWFRLGKWYTPEDESLAEETIFDELLTQIKNLYVVYIQMLWHGDNNFRDFYQP